jgi:hypothetical protein
VGTAIQYSQQVARTLGRSSVEVLTGPRSHGTVRRPRRLEAVPSLRVALARTTAAPDDELMRPDVQAFVDAGPLPDEDATEEEIQRRTDDLLAIAGPVSGEEARALVSCFGPDDCYGVAWSLLHLIETGPNPVLTVQPGPDANEWHRRLFDRAVNGGLVPPP